MILYDLFYIQNHLFHVYKSKIFPEKTTNNGAGNLTSKNILTEPEENFLTNQHRESFHPLYPRFSTDTTSIKSKFIEKYIFI